MSRHPSHRARPFAALRPTALALPLVLCTFAFRAALAQDASTGRGHPLFLDSVLSRPHSVSPLSGPPGTEVTVQMAGLPAITPLWLGIGAMRSGFEALTMVYTDATGAFSQVVAIPPWADRDRAFAFIVFDAYFARLALTRPFDVTGRDGTLQRRGQIGDPSGGCATLRSEDGVVYALAGEMPPVARQEQVILEGLPIDRSPACQGARSILVTSLFGLRRP